MDVDGNPTVSLGDIPIDFSKLKKEHKQVSSFISIQALFLHMC